MASNKDLEFDFEMLLLDLEKGRKKGNEKIYFIDGVIESFIIKNSK